MIVIVDLADSTVSLDEPDVFDAFSVRHIGTVSDGPTGTPTEAVGALLDDLGAGGPADDSDHVWVAIDAVRLLAEDQVDEGWADSFDAMVQGAQTKGWVSGDGTSIRAHLE